MQEVLKLIHDHGDLFYLITFIWTALEGETFVIFAAIAAHREILSIYPLFFAAWLGSFFGDQVFFWVGRRYGTKIVARYPSIQPKLNKVFAALEKHATAFILSYRFLYGIRNVSGIATGMSKLPWSRFLLLNFIAAGLWAFSFCAAGYFFGDLIASVTENETDAEMVMHEVMAMLVGLLVLILVARHYIMRAIRNRSEV